MHFIRAEAGCYTTKEKREGCRQDTIIALYSGIAIVHEIGHTIGFSVASKRDLTVTTSAGGGYQRRISNSNSLNLVKVSLRMLGGGGGGG